MKKKLEINPEIVEFDGHSFRLIIKDKEKHLEELKKKSDEIYKDLINKAEIEDIEYDEVDQNKRVTSSSKDCAGLTKREYILGQVVAGTLAGRTETIGGLAGKATAYAKSMIIITDAIMKELEESDK